MKHLLYSFLSPSLVCVFLISGYAWANITHDDCANAMLLPSPDSPHVACGAGGWMTSGPNIGTQFVVDKNGSGSASASGQLPFPLCQWASGGNEDAWFKVQIPAGADGLDIEWKNEGGCSGFLCNTDLNIAAYQAGASGSCQSLTFVSCASNDRYNLQAPGQPGDWIYLRVWERDDQGFKVSFPAIRAYSSTCDDCATALELTPPSPFQCGQTQQPSLTVNYSLLRSNGAFPAPSGSPILSNCRGGSDPQDIWLSVVLPQGTGGVEIQFENLGGCVDGTLLNLCETDVAFAWYTSNTGDCSGLEFRGCGKVNCFLGCNDGKIKVDGRPGEKVFVRIWEEQDQGFDIEVNLLTPTAPADKCYTALPLQGLGCNFQATSPKTGDYPEPDRWGAQAHTGTNYCDPPTNSQLWATNENTVWYTFSHPAGGPLDLELINVSCTGSGITPTFQMGVFTNSGGPTNPSCDLDLETGMGCAVGNDTVRLNIPALPSGDYILLVDGMGGNQCFWEFRGTDVLPVEMMYFKAWQSREQGYLEWANSQELNNAGFEILRSLDGEQFEEIDFVPALEVPNTLAGEYIYSYQDPDLSLSGQVYYRLKQVDIDGRYTMSHVVEVNFPVDPQLAQMGKAYPNPNRGAFTLPFFLGSAQPVSLQVLDINGRVAKRILQQERYEQGQHEVKVDLAELPNGMYFVRFQAHFQVQTVPIVLQR